MTDEETCAPARQITDFENMDVSQTGHNRYTVTNRESGTITEVRLSNPECDCEDFQYDPGERDGRKACKHIMYANYMADRTIKAEEWALQQLAQQQREVRESVIQQERLLSRLEGKKPHETTQETPQEPEPEPEPAEDDPVSATIDWLESHGVPSSKVKVWDDNGSIQIDTTQKLDDDEFAVLRETDWIWYDGDEGRNYIKEDNLREGVLA